MQQNRWLKTGVILGILTVSIRLLATEAWIEQYYSRGFFPAFRSLIDTFFTSWFPIPLVYVAIPILIFAILKNLRQWWKSPSLGKVLRAISGLLNFTGWTVGLFLLMWGFNYGRQPVEDKLGFEPIELNLTTLKHTIKQEVKTLSYLRARIENTDTTALTMGHFPIDMEQQLRQSLEDVLIYYNYLTVGNVRGRIVHPNGVLLRISTAGIYFPWTGEGHIDGGLLHVQRPYTMAHELAHGYGFGDEGTCSFWAYLASFNTKDPALTYAIRLGYWRRLATHWLRAEPQLYTDFREKMDKGIVADLIAINKNEEKYPDIFPRFRNSAYDTYLKAQGISEGIQNYGRVIDLVEAWRKSEGEDVFSRQ